MVATHEEGFGRVAVEALLCQTPVIVSNRGQLPNIVNKNVGMVIDVTPKNIADAINKLYKNKELLNKLKMNSRKLAVKKYSSINSEVHNYQ